MGWSIGYDPNWGRDIGYGVPAACDSPQCEESIDRGLAYVCGGEPYGGEKGCGLYFCSSHLWYTYPYDLDDELEEDDEPPVQLCRRCSDGESPYEPKPDVREWIDWKLTDASWAQWRAEHPAEVAEMTA